MNNHYEPLLITIFPGGTTHVYVDLPCLRRVTEPRYLCDRLARRSPTCLDYLILNEKQGVSQHRKLQIKFMYLDTYIYTNIQVYKYIYSCTVLSCIVLYCNAMQCNVMCVCAYSLCLSHLVSGETSNIQWIKTSAWKYLAIPNVGQTRVYT